MRDEPQKHFCPVCGSLMGLTRQAGQAVYCSWSDDNRDCAEYGFAVHDDGDNAKTPYGRFNRKWEPAAHYTGHHRPRDRK